MNPANLISMNSGLLDLSTNRTYPSTPSFFTRCAIPIDYDYDFAPEPVLWLEFLWQVFDGRQELVDLLQEAIGYSLSSDTSLQRVFHLWGPPRSGKGTILRILSDLNGRVNTRYPSIQSLAGRFGMESLIGASFLQVTDLDCDDKQALCPRGGHQRRPTMRP